MAFTKFVPDPTRPFGSRLATTVRVCASGSTRQLCIPASVLSMLGWAAGTRAAFLIGSGADAGKVRIIPDAAGVTLFKRSRAGQELGVSFSPRRIFSIPEGTTPIPHRIVDGALEIDLRAFLSAKSAAA